MQRHWLIPQGRHDPFYPQSQLPLSFLSTTLPLCCCPSNEEVRHRRRHNTPLHKEGMSVCQMGRGDYNMFPLPWWLNGAGMRTHLIQAGSFPWQNYESQFLRRKCTYPQPWGGKGGSLGEHIKVAQKSSSARTTGQAADLTSFWKLWSLHSSSDG